MTITLVLPQHIADQLHEAVAADVESAGVLLARPVQTDQSNLRLLGRSMHWVPDDAYLVRNETSLSIPSHGYIPTLAAAESDKAVPIWLHTHPGGESTPRPSEFDKIVDQELSDLFRLRSGSPMYGAVVVAKTGEHFCFSGHIETKHRRTDIDHMWVTGRRFRLEKNWLHESTPPSDQFNRHIRAFGGRIQEMLADLNVAVVGCGGTGSAVIEQLARLGVRNFILLDPKTLTESNLTRVYGAFPENIGIPKVELSAAHVARIAPDSSVITSQSKITKERTARMLTDADVVFGCTDDNAGRLVLSRLASYFLTPVIDCGVLLSSDDSGKLIGIDARVTVLSPGAACLVCRNRIDIQRAAAETLPPEEHSRLVTEGYAPALVGIEPAVVAFTTQVAAAAVTELLERLIQYGPEPVPTEILLRIHDREVSFNDQYPRDGHYCHADAGKLGIGDTTPFLEQTWQE